MVLTRKTRKDGSFEDEFLKKIPNISELDFSFTPLSIQNEWPYCENYDFLNQSWDLCILFNFDIRISPFESLINSQRYIHIDYDVFEMINPESTDSITRHYDLKINTTTLKLTSNTLMFQFALDASSATVMFPPVQINLISEAIRSLLSSTEPAIRNKPLSFDKIINSIKSYKKILIENSEYEDEIKKLSAVLSRQFDSKTELDRVSHRIVKVARLKLLQYPLLYKPLLSVAKMFISATTSIFKLSTTRTKKNDKWPNDIPLVSVIIPCYNYGDYIAEAVDSVLDQTFQNIEILIVDAGSTDGTTIPILKNLHRPKTRLFFREGRNYVGSNRNFGIMNARGKYVMCLDADDILRPTYIEQATFLLETGNYDLISTSVECFGEKNITWSLPQWPTLSEICNHNLISTIAMYRKDFFLKTGGYHDFGLAEDHVHEDWCLWVRFMALGARVRNIEAPLMLYRTHSSRSLSQQGNTVQDIQFQRKQVLNFNEKVLTKRSFDRSKRNNKITYKIQDPLINLIEQLPNSNKTLLLIENTYLIDSDLGLDKILKESNLNFSDCIFIAYTGVPKTRKNSRTPVIVLDGFLSQGEFVIFFDFIKSSYSKFRFLNWGMDLGIKNQLMLPITKNSKQKKIHVLICVPWLDVGGSSKLLMHIFSNLKFKGISTTIVATNPTKNLDPISGIDIYNSFSDDVVDIPYLHDNKLKQDRLLYLIGSRQCTHMMIVGSRVAYEALPKAKHLFPNLKTVDHLYNPIGHIQNNLEFKKFIDFNIAANSEVESALLKNGFKKEEIKIIYHGINTIEFSPNRISKIPSNSTKITFGFIGRLSPEKRPLDFLDLASKIPEANFILAGQGKLHKDVELKKESLGGLPNFEFLGFTESPFDLYKRVDVLVIPSEVEGLPLALLEAMSLKIPVIASRVGHIPHVIKDGINGYLFNPCSIEELTKKGKALIALSEANRIAMGENARKTVVEDYDLVNCANQYKVVFENLKEL